MGVYQVILICAAIIALAVGAVYGIAIDLLWIVPITFVLSALCIFILYILFVGATTLFVSKKKEYPSVSPFFKSILDGAYKFIMDASSIRLHTEGMEKLPEEDFLLVQNHVSYYDNMLTGVALKDRKLVFVSKPENFKIPIVGRLIARNLYVSIDRDNVKNAVKSINRSAEIIKEGLASVGIYPEGTRSLSGKLGEFKNGSFKIAIKASCPLVITAIKGTENIKKNIFRRKTDVYVKVVGVILPDKVAMMKTNELSALARGLIEGAFSEGAA